MIKKFTALILLASFCVLFLLGCNDSGKIWEAYCNESFCATVIYDTEGVRVCARVSVARDGSGDVITAELSSPDVLRGAVGRYEDGEALLSCGDIEIVGEGARSVMALPIALGAREASKIETVGTKEKRLIAVSVADGILYLDAESGELTGAILCKSECRVISFSRGK